MCRYKKTRRSKALKGNPNTPRHERERERMSACCLKRTCHFLYLNRVHHHLHCGLFLLLHTVACFQESCLRTKATLSCFASIFFLFLTRRCTTRPCTPSVIRAKCKAVAGVCRFFFCPEKGETHSGGVSCLAPSTGEISSIIQGSG